jgi:hypothetical protein
MPNGGISMNPSSMPAGRPIVVSRRERDERDRADHRDNVDNARVASADAAFKGTHWSLVLVGEPAFEHVQHGGRINAARVWLDESVGIAPRMALDLLR